MFFASASRGEQHSSYIIPLCTGTSFRTGPLPTFSFTTYLLPSLQERHIVTRNLLCLFPYQWFWERWHAQQCSCCQWSGTLGTNIMLTTHAAWVGNNSPTHFDDKTRKMMGDGKGHSLPCTVCVNDQGWGKQPITFFFYLFLPMFPKVEEGNYFF